jgi:two-component system, chemotaxis family, response regulator PixG
MSIASQANIKFKDLIAGFNQIRVEAVSGNLIVDIADTSSWMFYFSAGLLAGVSGGIDAIDRWKRNLALASLNMPLDRLVKSQNSQEIFLNSNKIAQAHVIQEILFDIIQFSQIKGDRLSYRFIPVNVKNTQTQSVLPLLEIQPILAATIQSWQKWDQQGLAAYSPSLFLTIQDSIPAANFEEHKNIQLLIDSIDGNKSLRSIAINHQKKLIDVAVALLPLMRQGMITLSPLKPAGTDLERNLSEQTDHQSELNSSSPTANSPAQSEPKPPLIACIDDSIAVYKSLERIIADRGYRSFGVQDPLKIITSLIRNKPDLIFLDLVMPVTNGYEVCEQIRKTPSLSSIPIIILTGNDGLIDRVRTKFVGANAFLGKPIESAAVIKMMDKYIGNPQSTKNDQQQKQIAPVIASVSRAAQQPLELLSNIGKQVLVVDDDHNIREVVSMCLHKLKGWDVLTAASGQEGLDRVKLDNPAVIILDVMMPEMDGLAFLRKLRSNPDTKLIPVILLTANRYLPDKKLLTELGVVETISKPFLPINLVRQIDLALLN